MKNKNKIISILMCLSLALVPGCSQDNGGEPAATPADAFAAGNADSIVTTTTAAEENPAGAVSDETAAEVTEAAETASGELFAYYDLLKEEYEKCGKLRDLVYMFNYSNDSNSYWITQIKEKLYNFRMNSDGVILYEYDVEKKEGKDIPFTLSDRLENYRFVYDDKNGYIYTIKGSYDGSNNTLSKYDGSGKLLNQLEWDGYLYQDGKFTVKLFSDGTFLTQEEGKHNLYSSDWTTKTEIPPLQAEVGHGLKKDVDFYGCNFVTKYNNKLYTYVLSGDAEGFYCLNTDTMTWEAVKSELSEMNRDSGYNWGYSDTVDIYAIGRYFLITTSYINQRAETSKIYDMETDTVIATVSNLGIVDYMGKDYDLILDRGVLTKNKYPSDGSEPVIETVIDTGDTSLKTNYSTMKDMLIPINEQYYVFEDEYGIFLREYDKGEDGEITVVMFEQQ